MHCYIQRRRFCLVIARICPRSACRSRRLAGFLDRVCFTLESQPHFLLSVRFQVETKFGDLSVPFVTCVKASSLNHDLERRGQEVSFDRGKSLAEYFNQRIKFFPIRSHSSFRLHKTFIESCKSFIIQCNFKCEFTSHLLNFDRKIYLI